MTNADYNTQRARTHAADEAHEKMLRWYAEQLGVNIANVNLSLVSLSSAKAKQLYQKYMDQL